MRIRYWMDIVRILDAHCYDIGGEYMRHYMGIICFPSQCELNTQIIISMS